jgi:hypothetical protein
MGMMTCTSKTKRNKEKPPLLNIYNKLPYELFTDCTYKISQAKAIKSLQIILIQLKIYFQIVKVVKVP